MRARLRKLWESRSPRDRVVIAILAAVVGAVLYLWLVQSAYQARTQLGSSVSVLRAQALRLDRDATELARVRAAQIPPVAQTDLRTQLQAQAAAAGLVGALTRIDAAEANQAQVVFGSVPFADWLAWVATLQTQHIPLIIARIEALSTPGLVSITATFTRVNAQ